MHASMGCIPLESLLETPFYTQSDRVVWIYLDLSEGSWRMIERCPLSGFLGRNRP